MQRFPGAGRQWLLLGTVITMLFGFALPAHADPSDSASSLSQRHPDAGIWVVYRGANTVADLQRTYIKGIMANVPWNAIYGGEDQFDWSKLDSRLDFIVNQVGKKAMVDVTVGYCPDLEWPEFLRNQVATRTTENRKGCNPLQFWDPEYVRLHKSYIRALADHLAEYDARDARPAVRDILFVRAHVMAETMETLPKEYSDWEWRDFAPAPNGRVYQVDLTEAIAYEYQREIVLTYQLELTRAYSQRGLPPPTAAVNKVGTYWRPTPHLESYVEAGVWFDHHNSSPNAPGWLYDMLTVVKEGAARGASESENNWPSSLLGQYTYWEILSALHNGVEFIGIYGANRSASALQPKGPVSFPENREAMTFGWTYAGHNRSPATSPGAWIALRGGYPEELWGNRLYPVRSFTNYEFLMTQYRPQDSILLVGVDHTLPEVLPIITRDTKAPWTGEIALCEERFLPRQCEFLHQQPDKFLQQSGSKYQYTFARSDLGQVRFCGTDMFCASDAPTTRTEPMLWARRTDGAGGSPYLRFDIDDSFAASLGGTARIRIVYQDKGSGKWQLRYDSRSGEQKSALVVQKTDSNEWKEVWVDLDDVEFANRQLGGTDLALYNMGDDDDIFHLVEVTRAGQAEVDLPDPQQDLPQEPGSSGDLPEANHSLYMPLLTR